MGCDFHLYIISNTNSHEGTFREGFMHRNYYPLQCFIYEHINTELGVNSTEFYVYHLMMYDDLVDCLNFLKLLKEDKDKAKSLIEHDEYVNWDDAGSDNDLLLNDYIQYFTELVENTSEKNYFLYLLET